MRSSGISISRTSRRPPPFFAGLFGWPPSLEAPETVANIHGGTGSSRFDNASSSASFCANSSSSCSTSTRSAFATNSRFFSSSSSSFTACQASRSLSRSPRSWSRSPSTARSFDSRPATRDSAVFSSSVVVPSGTALT